VLFVLIAAN